MDGDKGGSLEKAERGQTRRVTDKGIYLYKGMEMHLAGYELWSCLVSELLLSVLKSMKIRDPPSRSPLNLFATVFGRQ